ncbi:hypothetical protein [Blastopirellula retiformator]|uniref:Uncharacterized protein n=1 Tax=Blastopirellula retiformator TaxID=2527970 RepID=A0A5C5V3W6_9BACT|nr:hypothetical protein [Blastopirellula retiformator]TWT33258.1 hypothetical protein Enr8_30830 [Blastopirellula retiformator]
MDQMRVFLAAMKKYGFWVLTGLVLVASLGVWFYASMTIDADLAKQKSEIESKRNSAQQIASTEEHPNEKFAAGMEGWLNRYREDIAKSWQYQWESQQKELVWPKELNAGRIDFAATVNSVLQNHPIEAVPDEELVKGRTGLTTQLCEVYRDYIKEELPKLAEKIGAEWNVAENAGGGGGFAGGFAGGGGDFAMEGMGPMGGANPGVGVKERPVVLWDSANQQMIQAKSFDWSKRPNNRPTPREVLYAQEDLWVLENLMRIIKAVNGDTTEHHLAAIKRIEAIELGKGVANQRIQLELPPMIAAAGEDGMEMGMDGMGMGMDGIGMDGMGMDGMDPEMMGMDGMGMDGMGMDGMGMDGMGMGGAMAPVDPAMFRYVDKDYKKIDAETLKTAMTSPTEEGYYLAVAKRLPVRMRITIDQRKIDKLLVECGNADLMLEVRQLRLNPTTGASGGMGGMGGFAGGMPGGFEGGFDGGPGMPGGGQQKVDNRYDVPIEVYGIVYIYNPVNKELLGITDESESEDGLDGNETAMR